MSIRKKNTIVKGNGHVWCGIVVLGKVFPPESDSEMELPFVNQNHNIKTDPTGNVKIGL